MELLMEVCSSAGKIVLDLNLLSCYLRRQWDLASGCLTVLHVKYMCRIILSIYTKLLPVGVAW